MESIIPERLTNTRLLGIEHKHVPQDDFHYITLILDVLETPFVHEVHFTATGGDTLVIELLFAWTRVDKEIGEWMDSHPAMSPSPVSPPSPDDDEIPF